MPRSECPPSGARSWCPAGEPCASGPFLAGRRGLAGSRGAACGGAGGECDGLGCDLSAQVAACLSQALTLCTLCTLRTLSAPSAPSVPSLRPLCTLCALCTLCTLCTPFSGGTVERSAAARGRGGGGGRLPARGRGAARAGGGALPQGGAEAACGGVPRARAAAARGLGAGAAVRGRRRLRRELCWQGLRVRGLRGDAQGSLECIGLQPQIGDSLPPTPSPSPRLHHRPATCNRRPPPACPPSKPASPKPHVLARPRAGCARRGAPRHPLPRGHP